MNAPADTTPKDTTLRKKRKTVTIIVAVAAVILLVIALFTLFFDEAVLVRKDTIYHVSEHEKIIALTFDDGPSPVWTPQILRELNDAGVKATFFMIGQHVEQYPEIAKAVADAGHEIGNHSYDHHVLLYYNLPDLEKEIKNTEQVIYKATGVTTRYFRPPKAWITETEKHKIRDMGYEIVLWSLNSKDWVTFDDKYVVAYIASHAQSGDIILFHDSGGVFGTEGGDRHETVKTIPRLVRKMRQNGYSFVTVSELLARARN